MVAYLPAPAAGGCDNDGLCEFWETCATCGDCADSPTCCGDGACDTGEDSCSCSADCGPPSGFEAVCSDGVDDDCDGRIDCADTDCCGSASCTLSADADNDGFDMCTDCDETNPDAWGTPEAITTLRWEESTTLGRQVLRWDAPLETGGNGMVYDVLRSGEARHLLRSTCHAGDATTEFDDVTEPLPGEIYFYAVRGRTECPMYPNGSLGTMTSGAQRLGRECVPVGTARSASALDGEGLPPTASNPAVGVLGTSDGE